MSFHYVITFLRDLNKNNSKEWMDEHRDDYEKARDFLTGWVENLNGELESIDPNYSPVTGKEALSQINNNLLYHSDLPTYKDHFGIGLDHGKGNTGFYIHIGINGSFIGGGYHNPSSETLSNIRDTIAKSGDELKEIINQKSFVDTFGELVKEDPLKTAPQGFSQDHEHIELLRLKNYTVKHTITQKQIMADDFVETVLEIYQAMQPFLHYLNEAAAS